MRYTVKKTVCHGNNPIDTRTYQPGEVIELSDQYATPLLKCGAIEAHQPEQVELVINPIFQKGE